RSRELFARKVAGTANVTDAELVLIDHAGDRVEVELSSVPIRRGHRVIGVFGQVVRVEEPPAARTHLPLTPRQLEVLRPPEHGRSTTQIADELHLSKETVRNHVRHLLRSLGVYSRLEAVAAARAEHLVD